MCITTMFLIGYSVLICHSLSSGTRLAVGSPSSVHSLTSSIHADLRLPANHFPYISPSVTVVTIPSLFLSQCPCLVNFRFSSYSSSPFSSGTPIFCSIQTLVLYSVQLIRSYLGLLYIVDTKIITILFKINIAVLVVSSLPGSASVNHHEITNRQNN